MNEILFAYLLFSVLGWSTGYFVRENEKRWKIFSGILIMVAILLFIAAAFSTVAHMTILFLCVIFCLFTFFYFASALLGKKKPTPSPAPPGD